MVRRWPSPIDVIEAAGAIVFFTFLRLLPLDAASGLGGFLGRVVGPRLGITKRARANLRLAMPELSREAVERIIRDMWDNLGRVSAEYPHLRKFDAYKENGRVEIVDRGNIVARVPGKRYIFFSAHCGNWEIG